MAQSINTGPRPLKFHKATAATPTTQRFVEIAEIKENTVILKDGSLRAVLLVSSLNFDLKSEEEQQAIIGNYVGFLNMLDFPLEIVIQSRQLNIDAYLLDLNKKERQQSNELLRLQIADYSQAIKELIKLGQIMTKRFYVVVPYSSKALKRRGFWERIASLFFTTAALRLEEQRFRTYYHELDRRIEKVLAGLSGIGLRAAQLDTVSLIELFYNTYNLDLAEKQKMTNPEELRVD
ncbi:MAG: hypothetical protein WCW02_03790 [Candidatus Buchananbacteria bacterium]